MSHQHARPEGTSPSGCRGKIPYRTKRLAMGVLRVMRKSGKAKSETLHAYRCTACGHWHLGNSRVPPPLKTIRAAVGEVVEIEWRDPDSKETVRTRHEAPKR